MNVKYFENLFLLSLENQISRKIILSVDAEQKVAAVKISCWCCRMLVEQTEKSLSETRYRLDKKTQELGQSEDTRAQLELDLHSTR